MTITYPTNAVGLSRPTALEGWSPELPVPDVGCLTEGFLSSPRSCSGSTFAGEVTRVR
jgi:hypothetical protein